MKRLKKEQGKLKSLLNYDVEIKKYLSMETRLDADIRLYFAKFGKAEICMKQNEWGEVIASLLKK